MGRMSASAAPPRPRQVTLAASLIMGGSVLVVLTAFERLAGLHTLETRESVQRFLSQPPGADLGLGVQGVLTALRTLGMVAAGCATAAAILGYQVLQRSRSARLVLTVLALPLFLTGMATGGFLSSVVAASAVMLWFQPARDWFDGVTREPRPTPPPTAAGSGARPFTGFGAPPARTDRLQAWAPPRPEPAEEAATPEAVVARRPSAVTWACLLTWVCSALAIVAMAASIVVLATDPGLVFDELHRQNPQLRSEGVTDATLRTATYVLGGVVIGWSLAASLLAVLAFRGTGWARVPLVVSAAASAALLLLATVAQALLVVPLAAAVVTLALLVRPDVRAWFARSPGPASER
jgi:hypothetical protein